MTTNLRIRSMQPTELEFAAACTLAEGWQGETVIELAGPYLRDPAGFFVAEMDGQLVGMCTGVDYGTYGFLGGLIVLPAARGKGVGAALLMHTVQFLLGRGLESVFLDGVLRAVPLYERCGFKQVCRSLRLRGRAATAAHTYVQPMTIAHLAAVYELDREAFGADRRDFLQRRLALYPQFCRVALVNRQVAGYIMARPGHTALAVGPWIASLSLPRPLDLLEALAHDHPLAPLSLGCLADNQDAIEALQAAGFMVREDSPWRMVYGRFCQPGDPRLNYAIGSPAKG